MLVTRIKVDRFRSIKDLELKLEGPLAVLVGSNESGKSNILLALDKFFKFDEQISDT